jgi:hypothetical protein
MARYFFHMKCDAHCIEDEEGTEFETHGEARALAIKSLREMLAAAIKSGAAAFVVHAIVIADELGKDLDFVPLEEVLPDWLQGHI